MSVQFGKCNFDGKPVSADDLEEVRPVLAAYGPDGEGYLCHDNVGILYRAFHTTRESRRETQPYISKLGVVITWDGRLDNRKDLIERLAGELSPDSTDLEIVAAAYDRWGTDTFQELIGDWAFSAWNPRAQSLVLAKDFVGTRQLYYAREKDQITWCTILDPLVLLARHPFILEEEYLAGWLSFFSAPHLTPYVGIHAVPPSSFVHLGGGTERVTKYWDLDPAMRIRYRVDAEYEEHFRVVFSESVRRRLRSDLPVLAELSGGMDSSSIVCMADKILRHRGAEAPLLETVSYYNDSEPNWNERPYFERVEAKRGRTGLHINVGVVPKVDGEEMKCAFPVTPAFGEAADDLVRYLISSGCRVLLSGTGGDEVTGGVPTPLPELADLLARARLRRLARQLKIWALNKRVPWFHLFFGSARRFLPTTLLGTPTHKLPAPWLDSGFVKRNRKALQGYETRLSVFGPLPSFQEGISTLDGLRRQLACEPHAPPPFVQKTYPYLDRDLVEFLYAVPREQLLRPGQRRSLMRRALVGVVPDEILNRRRKACVSRAPLAAISNDWAHLQTVSEILVGSELGIVDQQRLAQTIEEAHQGHEVPVVSLMRTIAVETWLRCVRTRVSGELGSDAQETELTRPSTDKTLGGTHFAGQPYQTGGP